MEGQSTLAIAEAEGLTVRRVQQIIRAEIGRREANPAEDYLILQIARLERAVELLGRQIDDGKATVALAFVRAVEMLVKLGGGPLYLAGSQCRRSGEVAALGERLARLNAAREVVAGSAALAAKRGDGQAAEKTRGGEGRDFVDRADQ
ncbi:MAG: hypothetical protein E7774_01770 [Bradyrhizobium sp.]|nr:MAG: hypothetical protein E7774_01770 [Bradyrhizobium sp.]